MILLSGYIRFMRIGLFAGIPWGCGQGCARGLFSRDRGNTETLKPETEALTIQAEARLRPRPSELETETRPRRINSQARPSRGTTAPRDGLKTEASRPRPHSTSIHIIPRTDVVLKRSGEEYASLLNTINSHIFTNK